MMNHPYAFINSFIQAADAVNPDILRIIFSVVVCIAAVFTGLAIFVFLFNRLYRHQCRTLSVEKWFQIENQGNTESIFHLHLDPGNVKVFSTLLCQDRPLAYAPMIPEPETKTIQSVQPVSPASQKVTVQPTQSTKTSTPQVSEENMSAAKEAKKKAKGTIGFGRKIGGIVGAIGSLLPGDIGKSFKDQSTQIQTVTQKASMAIEEPEQKKQEMEHIRNEISGLGGKKQQQPPAISSTSTATVQSKNSDTTIKTSFSVSSDADVSSYADETPAPVKKIDSSANKTVFQKDVFQTPLMNPGDNLRLKLVLNPANIYRSVIVPLCIQSTQLVETEAGELQCVNSTETWQAIRLSGLPLNKTIIIILLGILIAAVNALWVVWVIRWFIGSFI